MPRFADWGSPWSDVAEADIKAGRLVRVLEGYTLPARMLHILYQKDRCQPLRARLFIDHLSERSRAAGA
jgi:DNA-binding transcriptional LysR family regulator